MRWNLQAHPALDHCSYGATHPSPNPNSSTLYPTTNSQPPNRCQVFSILVLAGDPAVEVKGAIQEVALKAGASATWVFIPIKPGKYPLRCTVKGHESMLGQLVIKRAE